jgi:hypothetical protein
LLGILKKSAPGKYLHHYTSYSKTDCRYGFSVL